MANNLKDMVIDEGSFVDKGANKLAKIVFFKRDGGDLSKGYAPEGSYEALGETICDVYKEKFNADAYVRATFPTRVIVTEYKRDLGTEDVYSVDWAVIDGAITLGERKEVEQRTSFIAKGKTEDGEEFPASDYAYVPDKEKSSTWKLRLTSTPGGTPDAGIVGAAVAALGKGFRGQKVQIPAEDLEAVKAKVKAAWKKANPDKSDEDIPEILKGGEDMKKAGKTVSSATAGVLKTAAESIKAALDKIMSLMAMPEDDDMKKGANMLTEEQRNALPEEVQKYLGELEAKIEKLPAPEPQDVMKNLPEEVRKRVEDAEAEAKEAKEVAKAEREARISKQYEDEGKDFPKLGSAEKIAKMLRSADEQGEEQGKELRETLKAAQAQIDANDLLSKELGRTVSDSVDSAWAKIEAMAVEIAKSGDITKELAIKKVLETDEGKALYAEYERSEK